MKNRKFVFIIITLIWTAVIFSFSLQSGEVSGDLSGSVLEALLGFFMPGVLESPEKLELFHLILRKCAHFTEFMILGVLSSITLKHMKVGYKSIIGLGYCVLIASLDETLQLFISGRAGRVQDVLIDSAGALAGIVIAFIFFKFIKCDLEK
jgi:VanZ family protein